jgi:hypothetical protein
MCSGGDGGDGGGGGSDGGGSDGGGGNGGSDGGDGGGNDGSMGSGIGDSGDSDSSGVGIAAAAAAADAAAAGQSGIPGVGGFGIGPGMGSLGEASIGTPGDAGFGNIAGIADSAIGEAASFGVGPATSPSVSAALGNDPAAGSMAAALGIGNLNDATGQNNDTAVAGIPGVDDTAPGLTAALNSAFGALPGMVSNPTADNPSLPTAITDPENQEMAPNNQPGLPPSSPPTAAELGVADEPANNFGNLSSEFGSFTTSTANPGVSISNGLSLPGQSNNFGNLAGEFGEFTDAMPGVTATQSAATTDAALAAFSNLAVDGFHGQVDTTSESLGNFGQPGHGSQGGGPSGGHSAPSGGGSTGSGTPGSAPSNPGTPSSPNDNAGGVPWGFGVFGSGLNDFGSAFRR